MLVPPLSLLCFQPGFSPLQLTPRPLSPDVLPSPPMVYPWEGRPAVSSCKQRVPLTCPFPITQAHHLGGLVIQRPLTSDVSPSITMSWSLTLPIPCAITLASLNAHHWPEPILIQPHGGCHFHHVNPQLQESPECPLSLNFVQVPQSALPTYPILPLSGLTSFPSLSPSSAAPSVLSALEFNS